MSNDLLKRLIKLQDDTRRSVVTREQVAALGLPTHDDGTPNPNELKWFELLGGKDPSDDTALLSRSESSSNLIDKTGLLTDLDRSLALVDEPLIWLGAGVDTLLKHLKLTDAVKQTCKDKLVGLLLNAYGKQVQLLEGLFQETAKLPLERVVAVIHWADSSVYSILVDALDAEANPALIEHFQRVSQHAEIVVHLRLSDSALRLFLVNPSWLGSDQYSKSDSEPSLADLYLFERFSRWLHAQSEPEDTVLSYFSLANPPEAKLKNKALRKVASETANGALARLLEWSETEVATLTDELPKKRACSMVQVDWVRRCQATCATSCAKCGR
ncbi:hypothetical protein [Pseudomonas fluorescens]|uniref:hypothetical protein n=1 Tax=Pseudomonas fluorescens TaxID=294 RepID=UPI003D1B096E